MKKNNYKGFTIIELLVVVVIIAVLAVIVMTNITQYINRGKNSAIKANLGTVTTNGAVFLKDNGNLNGFCGDPYFTVPQIAIANAGGTAICDCDMAGCGSIPAASSAWCSCSTLVPVGDGNTFCVDSRGFKGEFNDTCANRCNQLTGAFCQS